jgi:hypothetical protein
MLTSFTLFESELLWLLLLYNISDENCKVLTAYSRNFKEICNQARAKSTFNLLSYFPVQILCDFLILPHFIIVHNKYSYYI